ncbi:hypothetical protein MPSEU_000629700 [Mayamaea pseudoterrestris]|nr:hypothetical protein MPSEU_000629700 [Mayamaea pseudoterrestris]
MTSTVMPSRLLISVFTLALLSLHVADAQNSMCGSSGFSIAGSASVLPIAIAWRDAYISACPNLEITVEGGGSTEGANRFCGNVDGNTSAIVEIGDMSRDWDATEATTTTNDDTYEYDCLIGDNTRSAIQIDVALDGISVVSTGGGSAATCMETLKGLTMDQLRWIFSSYTEAQLAETGWNANSVANSDGDDSTRLWSELDASCDEVAITIAGPSNTSGTFDYFVETVLLDADNGETFDLARNYTGNDDPEVNIALIENDSAAVAFFGYSYYYSHGIELYAAAIQNSDGVFVTPGADSVADGTYNPLSRRLYMNLLNDAKSLANTAPFVYFGYSPDGSDIVSTTGYVPIPNPSEMMARIADHSNAPNVNNVVDETSTSDAAASEVGMLMAMMMGSLAMVM